MMQGKLPRQQWKHRLLRPLPLLLHGLDGQALVGQVDQYPNSSIPFHIAFEYLHLDWTMVLWITRERKELYSFEASGDYVMDVAWSPVSRKIRQKPVHARCHQQWHGP